AGAMVEAAADCRPLQAQAVALSRRKRWQTENRENEKRLDRLHNADLGTAEGRDRFLRKSEARLRDTDACLTRITRFSRLRRMRIRASAFRCPVLLPCASCRSATL